MRMKKTWRHRFSENGLVEASLEEGALELSHGWRPKGRGRYAWDSVLIPAEAIQDFLLWLSRQINKNGTLRHYMEAVTVLRLMVDCLETYWAGPPGVDQGPLEEMQALVARAKKVLAMP